MAGYTSSRKKHAVQSALRWETMPKGAAQHATVCDTREQHGIFDRISQGLQRSRDKFKEEMNVLLDRGPDLDEEFWDGLEETLILADIGGAAACDIVENLRDQATRKALPDAYAVLDLLNDQIADTFTEGGRGNSAATRPVCCSSASTARGRPPRSAKSPKKQTDAGAQRHPRFRRHVPRRGHRAARGMGAPRRCGGLHPRTGSDPASVCYDTIERAEVGRMPTSCSSTRRGVFIRRPISCASWKKW